MEKIFISYAWESSSFKADVLKFGRWLAEQLNLRAKGQYHVVMDFLFSVVPPPEGWPIWMRNEIHSAHTVLVICSPKYLNAYTKTGESGRGSTFEGAIITQTLYNNYQQNKKFYPILQDGGDVAHIPIELQPWWNNLHFETNNEEILRLIFRQNPSLLKQEDPATETKIVQEIVQQVEEENKIIEEIAHSIDANSEAMVNPVQTLVRAFVTLSSIEKIQIAKNIGIYNASYHGMSASDVDKAIFIEVKNKKLASRLWDEVSQYSNFSQKNPFN
jgi:hypothetical protein